MQIDSLDITGYRLFERLRLSPLGRVNLITGKDGAGETVLLEVVRTFVHRASLPAVGPILLQREELVPWLAWRERPGTSFGRRSRPACSTPRNRWPAGSSTG